MVWLYGLDPELVGRKPLARLKAERLLKSRSYTSLPLIPRHLTTRTATVTSSPLNDRLDAATQTVGKTVCMIVPAYWDPIMGGAQYQAKVLLERMSDRGGFDLHYLARELSDTAKPTTHRVHRIGHSRGMHFVRDTPKLLATLKELQPDVIYVHVGCAYLGVAAHYCKKRQCQLVWHLASDVDVEPWTLRQRRNPIMSFIDKKFIEYGLRRAAAIVAQTNHQAELLRTHYGRTATAVIKNFHPPAKEPLAKSSPPTVLWVANLKTVKQPEIFQQLAAAASKIPARFVMLGGMQLAPDRRDQLLATIDATPNLEWRGAVSQDEVNSAFAQADLLVNTSVYEGFSNTFIQAWQRRVPVLSLQVDPDKLLNDGGLGACANGDFDKLCTLLESFLQNPDLRESVGVKAQAYAETNHGLAAADLLIDLLTSSPT